jgi:hypothetical protein
VGAKTGNLTAEGSLKPDNPPSGKSKAKTDDNINFRYGMGHWVILIRKIGSFNYLLKTV